MEKDLINNKKCYTEKEKIENLHLNDAVASSSVKQYIYNLYEEFMKSFEQRSFDKIETIIKNITNVDPEANILNSIYGQICLFRGDGDEAYKYLLKYSENSQKVDLFALSSMALWNMFSGHYSLALKQFSYVLSGTFSTKFLIFIMINVAKAKKRLGFYDRSLDYLQRLQCVPEGYKMIMLIRLEIIHLYILKNDFNSAFEEIENYMQSDCNRYIKRLKVYLLYQQKNYKGILKFINDNNNDPYIYYIIARIGMENSSLINIDVIHYLEEAITITKGNKYIYNTFGNYFSSIKRFSEAAEQYNCALSIDPNFKPAKENLYIFDRAKNIDDSLFNTEKFKNMTNMFVEVVPDVEELGFFDTWKLFGFSSFRSNYASKANIVSLKYYIN